MRLTARRYGTGARPVGAPRRGRWGRNLRGGVDASLLVNGRWRPATAEAIEDEPTIAAALVRRDWPRRLLMPLPPSDSVLVRVTLKEPEVV